MKIAQMENFEAVECFWDTRRNYIMSSQFDLRGVPQPASVKTRQLEAGTNGNVEWKQILQCENNLCPVQKPGLRDQLRFPDAIESVGAPGASPKPHRSLDSLFNPSG